MRYVAKAALFAAIVLLPALAHAQSLAGTVRDASGAVLPGVTVEAASPALLEKVRTATTDGTGQYRIENLTPGAYTVTFSLAGFVTVQREARGSQRCTGHHDQRRPAGRRRAGNHHGHGRDAARGRAHRRPHAKGDRQRGDRGAAGLARLRQHPRHRARHSGHGSQLGRQSGDELLHRARRARQRRHDPDRRHERRIGVQRRRRRRVRLRHGERHGNPGDDRGRSRRDRSRRPGLQHDSANRRQQLQRHLLHELRRRVGAVEQSG